MPARSRSVSRPAGRFFLVLVVLLLVASAAAAQAPASPHPKPFESGYFPAYEQPTVVSSRYDLEVKTDPRRFVVRYPLDPYVARTLIVKNVGTTRVRVEYSATIDIPDFEPDLFINHPQPPTLYLEAGESMPIRLAYNIPGRVQWEVGRTIDAPITLRLSAWRAGQVGEPPSISIPLPNGVEVVGRFGRAFVPLPANAMITGRVQDGTGAGVARTQVTVRNGPGAVRTDTDGTGGFSVGVHTAQRTGLPSWSEFAVSVERNRTADAGRVVTVGPDETVELSIRQAAPAAVSYAAARSLDIDLQAYDFDASADGRVMAVVPFHTALRPAELAARAHLTVFTSEGDLLWRTPINGETPAIDVSDDGSLVATTIQRVAGEGPWGFGGTPVVFDREGRKVFEFPVPRTEYWFGTVEDPFTEVRLSHDKRYLAAGDKAGRLYLIELDGSRVVWSAFTGGQVRFIEFDTADARLFVSSGDGYLRGYGLDGRQLWKTYVDAWLTNMDVSVRYILATSKAGRSALHLIDKSSGETLWSYPLEMRGSCALIAPTEEYVWYSNDVGGGSTTLNNAVFGIDGTPRFDFGTGAKACATTADGALLAFTDACSVSVADADGYLGWTETVATSDACAGTMNQALWMAPDGSRFVAAVGDGGERWSGKLYFYARQGASARSASR